MYSVLVEVSDKLILKMLHISPPNGKVAAIRQVQSPTALFANVGKIYEKAVVAAAKKVNREEFPPFGSATAAKISRHVSYEEPCRVPGSRHSKYPLSV